MKKKIQILCTLGPASINKKILKFLNNKVSMVRLNLSHIKINEIKKKIKKIRKYCSVPICIDTEGAQIRTMVKKDRKFYNSRIGLIQKTNGYFNLYPEGVFKQIKKGDILDIGFDHLQRLTTKLQNIAVAWIYTVHILIKPMLPLTSKF